MWVMFSSRRCPIKEVAHRLIKSSDPIIVRTGQKLIEQSRARVIWGWVIEEAWGVKIGSLGFICFGIRAITNIGDLSAISLPDLDRSIGIDRRSNGVSMFATF